MAAWNTVPTERISIHNFVSRSGCNLVPAAVRINHKCLSVQITDNGKGFGAQSPKNGSRAGLESIRRKSAWAPGAGRSVALGEPLLDDDECEAA